MRITAIIWADITLWSPEIPAAAIRLIRAAVQLDPHSARYWFDLASAYQVLGDVSNQTEALEHAIKPIPPLQT